MRTRTISAVIAVALLAAIFYLWRLDGLFLICGIVALGASFEYARMVFPKTKASPAIRWIFLPFSMLVFYSHVAQWQLAPTITVLASIVFATILVLMVRTTVDLPRTLHLQGAGILGLIYCGACPAFAALLLNLPNGEVWLFGLLAVVFAGDTMAYLAGRAFGKRKLLEPVSPKKTVAGSIGGLFGSALAGALLGIFFLEHVPLWALILTAVATGAFAQVGDLFESLVKRVADVKDSGAIMPGHGGVLDRVDGVLFGGPVYYALIRFLT